MSDEERDENAPEQPETDAPATPDADAPAAGDGGDSAAADPQEAEDEQPVAEQPADEPPAESEPAATEHADEQTTDERQPADEVAPEAADEQVAGEAAEEESPAVAEAPAAEERERPARSRGSADESQSEAIPGAHLEPDLVLDPTPEQQDEYGERAGAEIRAAEEAFGDDSSEAGAATAEPAPRRVLDLAADARYAATGKRKRAVARVILKPGSGAYTINGRELETFFPRTTLQHTARGPLETVGQQERMDVVAKIHGGGVASQAGALRHGIARALVEADPSLRGELKRRGFLTRDPRVKERKKAGLKKARKRPQFSKR